MSGVPYVFGSATTSIPLSEFDANFNTGLTIGSTTVGLGNTTSTLTNVTVSNVTVSSVSTPITVSQGGTGLTSVTSSYIPYGNGTSALNTSSNLVFDGTNLSVGGQITQGGTTLSFTNLTTTYQLWTGLSANKSIVVTMITTGSLRVQFILAMSYDGSNLNVCATNLSGATVGTSGSSATIQPGDGKTYTIARDGATGYYTWEASSATTGTTYIIYRPLGDY